jgi:hypothetical protein
MSSLAIKENPPSASAAQQEQATLNPPKTTGEKWFDRIRFVIGETTVLGLTAALAFIASPEYGPAKIGPVKNYLKTFTRWTENKLLNNSILPLAERGPFGARLAKSIASTTVLVHGGNLYIPVYAAIQNRKEKIVNAINARWGKPGEVEAGEERLKHQTKETLGDIVKGRLGSWLIVFASFFGADMIAGKDMKDPHQRYRFDKFEDKFGRWVAGFTREGKEIAKIPISEKLPEAMLANKTYRFGKILALDIYATTAAIAIWTTISRLSAVVRGKKAREMSEEKEAFVAGRQSAISEGPRMAETQSAVPQQEKKPSYASRVNAPAGSYRAMAEKEPAAQAAIAH